MRLGENWTGIVFAWVPSMSGIDVTISVELRARDTDSRHGKGEVKRGNGCSDGVLIVILDQRLGCCGAPVAH